jgi:hypothetical protein
MKIIPWAKAEGKLSFERRNRLIGVERILKASCENSDASQDLQPVFTVVKEVPSGDESLSGI